MVIWFKFIIIWLFVIIWRDLFEIIWCLFLIICSWLLDIIYPSQIKAIKAESLDDFLVIISMI